VGANNSTLRKIRLAKLLTGSLLCNNRVSNARWNCQNNHQQRHGLVSLHVGSFFYAIASTRSYRMMSSSHAVTPDAQCVVVIWWAELNTCGDGGDGGVGDGGVNPSPTQRSTWRRRDDHRTLSKFASLVALRRSHTAQDRPHPVCRAYTVLGMSLSCNFVNAYAKIFLLNVCTSIRRPADCFPSR